MQGEPRGTLKLTAPMSFGVAHLASILSKFVDRYPAVDIDMDMDDRYVDLIKGGYDLAVRIASNLKDSSLIARYIAPIKMVVCASPAYLEKRGTPKKPQDISGHAILTYRYQYSPHEWEFIARDGTVETVKVQDKVQD